MSAAAQGGWFARAGDALERPRVLGTVMLAPAVLYIVAFVAVPFCIAIALSFSDATVGDPTISSFVGLENFRAVMQQEAFMSALRNSIIVTVATVVGIVVLATIAVEILAREFPGRRLVQVLFMLPWAMPVALAAITWLWLLDSQFSPIDWLLVQLGLLGPGTPLGPAKHLYYLGREWLGLGSVVFVDIWRTLPLATIIVLAGRLSIPRERLEQAQIDGAGFFRVLLRIIIPALAPVLIVAILFTALLVIGEMSTVALLTRGGPGHSGQILPYWAYLKGIESGDLAQGAAVSLFLFPVLAAAAIVALRFAARLHRD
ncbi:Trehalose transport system permease protein SugA [wastewater metagenome]|uniref:Trehalose transport system permease protein SugA n=2 Tax=unclassified sequences TaxID=12908 RepID=A0A5B8R7Y9_9ZZZZ|nr:MULTISPECIES: sugar ABC transporter permease [Arhodomonas]MCS4504655.1 sugar ABC transporter permease [Arhodomonas aquaeolei]QEA04078.1 trehalose transport system permease protein SugA [uncultured organism]